MPWSTINTSEVMNGFTPGELATLSGIQGSADVLTEKLNLAVRAARGSIVAGGNPLDAAPDTIPDQLRNAVLDVARWKWLISFPTLKTYQTDARKSAAKDAEDLLNLIASQKADRPRVETPDGTSPLTSPSFCTPTRVMSKENQEGV